MQTKSYAYNEALRDIEKYKISLTEQQIRNWINTEIKGERDIEYNDNFWKSEKELVGNGHFPLAWETEQEIIKTGAYPYNSTVSIHTLSRMDILSPSDNILQKMNSVIYNTKHYYRALGLVTHFDEMIQNGYKSVDDMDIAENGKKAVITGINDSGAIFQTKKDNEQVKLVVTPDNRKGYQKPRMRTKFYTFTHGSELFYKLV